MKRILFSFLVLTLFLSTFSATALTLPQTEKAALDTANYVYQAVKTPDIGSVGGEWAVFGLSRTGTASEDYYSSYYEKLESYTKRKSGDLSDRKFTEYSRIIITLSAIGKDPRNVAGYDLIKPLGDFEKVTFQGINGAIWALIALDSAGYEMPKNPEAKVQATRELYVDHILKNQLSDGGFSLTGQAPSQVDITGMALSALSEYANNEKVASGIQKAVSFLLGVKPETSEELSQAIIGLCSLGEEKIAASLSTQLMEFSGESGGFRHIKSDTEVNQMSTEQALCALSALSRIMEGRASLYNLTDVPHTDRSKYSFGLMGKHKDIKMNPVSEREKTFSDITLNKNRIAIEELAKRNIISGRTDTLFMPESRMTRAEFSAILVRALGFDPSNSTVFSDVSQTDWYYGSVNTAFSYHIVNGVSKSRFSPKGSITRQEAAVMITRAAALCGIKTALTETEIRDTLAAFTDYKTVKPWAEGSLAFCYAQEILSDDGLQILPSLAITRGEVAQMLFNLLDRAKLLS